MDQNGKPKTKEEQVKNIFKNCVDLNSDEMLQASRGGDVFKFYRDKLTSGFQFQIDSKDEDPMLLEFFGLADLTKFTESMEGFERLTFIKTSLDI